MSTKVTYQPIQDIHKVTAEIDESQTVTITITPWESEPLKYVNVFNMEQASYMDVINSLSGLVDISIAEYKGKRQVGKWTIDNQEGGK